jgi:hypothetical protein
VDPAGEHANRRARGVCAGPQSGEVVLFDKAQVDFDHLHGLDVRGVTWGTRAKDNFQHTVMRRLPVPASGRICMDEIIRLIGPGQKTTRVDPVVGGGMGGSGRQGAGHGLHLIRPAGRPLRAACGCLSRSTRFQHRGVGRRQRRSSE